MLTLQDIDSKIKMEIKVLKKDVVSFTKHPFKKADLLVYSIVALFICGLFLVFFLLPKEQAKGFCVSVDDKTAFTYLYSDNSYEVGQGFSDRITVENNAGDVTVTVFIDESKTEYNVIYFNKTKRTVKVIDSNCSIRKDCVYSQEISDSGAIICVPHKLRVLPLNPVSFNPRVG